MDINWTNDLIFHLIDLYRERRLLWDHDMPEYKDKGKKHRTWQDIADIMNVPKEILMRKMKILTTQFQREHAKSRHLPPEEGSKWYAYTRMLFLAPNSTSRTSATTTTTTALNTYEHYQVSPIGDFTIEVKEEVDMSEGESFQSSASTSTCRKRRAAPAPEPTVARDASSASRDEYSLYGEYVALKLRKITDAYTRHKAQQQINDVLFQAEMEDLSQ